MIKQWPTWITTTTLIWSLTCACGLAIAAISGHGSLFFLQRSSYVIAAAMFAGFALTLFAARSSSKRRTNRFLIVLLFIVAALCLSATVGLLLSLIELVTTGTVQDKHGGQNWLTVISQMAVLFAGVLFLGTAQVWHWKLTGICPRSGKLHRFGVFPMKPRPPKAASRRMRLIANIGCLAFLPYFVMHSLTVFGYNGTIRIYDHRPTIGMWVLLIIGIGLASFLLQGLVRPWGLIFPKWSIFFNGKRVPRALPLTPVWFIAPTLSIYGTVAIGLTLLVAANRLPGYQRDEALLLGGAAAFAFATYGWALAVVAVSYWRRTRPICITASVKKTKRIISQKEPKGSRLKLPQTPTRQVRY